MIEWRKACASVLVPVGAFVISLAAGIPGLGAASYWNDEAASLSAAGRSLESLWSLVTRTDGVHAAYYVLLHFWMSWFGTAEATTRLLSVLAVALACAGFAAFTQRLAGRRLAILAVVLFVTCPGISWASQELRGTASFALCCVTWALYFLARALDTSTIPAWALFAAMSLASVAFNIYCCLMVVAHLALWRLTGRAAPSLRKLGVAWACVILAASPLLVTAVRQRSQVSWNDDSLIWLLNQLTTTQVFKGDQLGHLSTATTAVLIIAPLIVVALLASAQGLARPGGKLGTAYWFGLAWIALPTALVVAATALPGKDVAFMVRYVTFATPGVSLAMAAALLMLWRSGRRVLPIALAAGVLTTAIPVLIDQHSSRSNPEDLRALARVSAGAQTAVFLGGSRHIAIAYPAEFTGVLDLELLKTPEESGTLAGISRDVSLSGRGAVGRTVVYYRSTSPDSLLLAESNLAEERCEPVEDAGLKDKRYSAAVFDCGFDG